MVIYLISGLLRLPVAVTEEELCKVGGATARPLPC